MASDYEQLLDLPVLAVDFGTKLAAAAGSMRAIDSLVQAKAHSDRKQYDRKNEILKQLIAASPDDFVIDQDGHYPGLTHVPTGFRIHTAKHVAAPITKTDLKSAHYSPVLTISSEKSAAAGDHPFTIAVDLDGTIAEKEVPFDPKSIGKPRDGAKKWLKKFKDAGARLIVFTVRGDNKLVKDWLVEHEMPHDHINNNPDQPPDSSGKIFADVYWDDRAINAEDLESSGHEILAKIDDDDIPDLLSGCTIVIQRSTHITLGAAPETVSKSAGINNTESLMFDTRIDVPQQTRTVIIDMLNDQLANIIDLAAQAKQAHWNVKGPSFMALHGLFDDIAGDMGKHADTIAERATSLGGEALGTVESVAKRSKLKPYPLHLKTGEEHVKAMAVAIAEAGKRVRTAASVALGDEIDDIDTADIFTGISRDLDKKLWFVEAHLQAKT